RPPPTPSARQWLDPDRLRFAAHPQQGQDPPPPEPQTSPTHPRRAHPSCAAVTRHTPSASASAGPAPSFDKLRTRPTANETALSQQEEWLRIREGTGPPTPASAQTAVRPSALQSRLMLSLSKHEARRSAAETGLVLRQAQDEAYCNEVAPPQQRNGFGFANGGTDTPTPASASTVVRPPALQSRLMLSLSKHEARRSAAGTGPVLRHAQDERLPHEVAPSQRRKRLRIGE